jgi:hypothetical protein
MIGLLLKQVLNIIFTTTPLETANADSDVMIGKPHITPIGAILIFFRKLIAIEFIYLCTHLFIYLF